MKRLILIGLLFASSFAFALDDAGQQRLADIQTRWAQIQYRTAESERAAAFAKLAADTQVFTRQQPSAAEAWIWNGIVTSSWAGAEGGLGALGKVKDARASLEKALALDPKALQGSAYTSLAALYDRVPGWPIGFGDAGKAETLLQEALRLNPDGIDSLYFWGDHLYRQDRFAESRQALERALQAAPRPGRELADQGRREEINALLKTLKDK
ncbi:tetratricopeptide repeat protein [Pseudomonas tohonis]|uniref:tetratricopeptide repeat protein n=1 Tax=Pseudomonas tohonis TaxID=2725477 RepID=UPI0021D80B55|nr:hypothetical protein [Pseudomonas tohonis]UXY54661.1 hypothetical protein N9L84_08850 [Pseudomonas tohonis]